MSTHDALDAPTLRRQIAEAMGWRAEQRKLSHSGDIIWLVLVRPDGTIFEHTDGHLPRFRAGEPDAERYLFEWCPNWPEDQGEALALCYDIAQRHGWHMLIEPVGDDTEVRFCSRDEHFQSHREHIALGPTPALALSALALAALEAERQP